MSDVLYDGRTEDDWQEELIPQTKWMRKHFFLAISLLGEPCSFLDVGCGIGSVLDVARRLFPFSFGVDQLEDDFHETYPDGTPIYFQHNLVEKFTLPDIAGKVSMVWCTEVAEHLDPSAHATLCDTLTDNLAEGRGNYLVFSAAHPSQGGTGHLSERPSQYWKDQFAMRDLNYRHDLTVNLSLLWSNIKSPLYWLAANVMVFEK